MTTWFTSDLHLGHTNIIKYCNRPYANIDEMNNTLIANYNFLVRPKDEVFILGDLALVNKEKAIWFVSRLNGKKHLVYGNHDKPNRRTYEESGLFEWCKDVADISVDGIKVVLSHYPFLTWNKSGNGSYNLHGHCHGGLQPDNHSLRMDVGVDPNGYVPINFAAIQKVMSGKKFKAIDHHGAD